MKASWLTIHELASALKVSVKTIRRAYLSGEIPVERLFRSVRFDAEQVKEAMRRNGQGHFGETATQQGESFAPPVARGLCPFRWTACLTCSTSKRTMRPIRITGRTPFQ